jgi:glutamyl endopeptidase
MLNRKGLFNPVVLSIIVLLLMTQIVVATPATDPNQPIGINGPALPQPEYSRNNLGNSNNKPFAGTLTDTTARSVRIPNHHLNLPPIKPPYTKNTSTRSIIGADGRTRVNPTTAYPNRAIAYLVIEFGTTSGTCTGWFIGPNTVATAGHCIYDTATNRWASKITVYAGRNGSIAVATTSAKYWMSVTGWVISENWEYDYGVIKTTNNTGNTVGWFGFRWQSSNTFAGNYIIRGYPGDKARGTMWTMNGAVTTRSNLNPRKLWYTIDTAGGQSGSPVYATYNEECCYGIAVHAYGLSSGYNSGTRITKDVYNNLLMWKSMR